MKTVTEMREFGNRYGIKEYQDKVVTLIIWKNKE